MQFNSISFLIFFVVFVVVYGFSKTSQKITTLTLTSGLFYFIAGPSSLVYLLVITCVTYFAARNLQTNRGNKTILILAISCIVSLLVSSKYTSLPQFIHDVISGPGQYFSGYMLPIGISFYSLQAIGLLIDLQNRRYTNRVKPLDTLLFVSFFPQSLAGPIHRAGELMPQFSPGRVTTMDSILVGIKTLLFGFVCKLIVADKLALLIDPLFSHPSEHDGTLLLTATVLYSFQLYFDFWGYSLIALGIGKCIGYDLKVNFKNPYLASSFKDFWHRWHTSLSTWMRDYIYIPLGGKRKGYIPFVFAISITFLISGLWHGASFNFFLWGFVHALLYLIDDGLDRSFKSSYQTALGHQLQSLLRRMLFWVTIPFTWLVFRVNDTVDMVYIFHKIVQSMHGFSLSSSIDHYTTGVNFIYFIICLLIIIIAHLPFLQRRVNNLPRTKLEHGYDSAFVTVCLTLMILFGDIGTQEFLYFNF